MHEQKFYHEVLTPTISLLTRAAENVCIAPAFSDVMSLAKQAASAAYHFREPILRKSGTDRIDAMKSDEAEELRQRLADIVDSSKHGPLRDESRITTLHALLAFEFNNNGLFRYLRTEVIGTNNRWGTFEVADTIKSFLPFLTAELGIGIKLDISLPTHPFLEWAETYLTSKSGFDLKSINLSFYRRNSAGVLEPADPAECKFRVIEA
jgi:hypothetical protein